MDAGSFIDLQEALLWFFGPFIVNLMMVLIAGGILTAIGVIIQGVAARLSR